MEEFLKKLEDEKIAISVYTKEDYDNLLDWLDSLGYRWVSGSEMSQRSGVWELRDGVLCIELDPNHIFAVSDKKRLVTHCPKSYFEEKDYKIIKYNEFVEKIKMKKDEVGDDTIPVPEKENNKYMTIEDYFGKEKGWLGEVEDIEGRSVRVGDIIYIEPSDNDSTLKGGYYLITRGTGTFSWGAKCFSLEVEEPRNESHKYKFLRDQCITPQKGDKNRKLILVCNLVDSLKNAEGKDLNLINLITDSEELEKLPKNEKEKIKKVDKSKQKPMLKKLTDALKKHLHSNIQKQYKANLRNGDLELTEKGRKLLLEILANEYEDELTEKAEEIIKEVKEEEGSKN